MVDDEVERQDEEGDDFIAIGDDERARNAGLGRQRAFEK